MNLENKELDALVLQARRDGFQVKVVPTKHPQEYGDVALEVTHNGSSWQVVYLSPVERLAVIRALLNYDNLL